MGKQKVHSTTQDFTEVLDIIDTVVYLKGKNASSVLEVSSVNFFLLSQDEQNARLYGYMSLLNSLSFPLQILIVSKRVDLTNYVKMLEQKISTVQNPRLLEHLQMYKDFIQELVKGEGLLDKKVYIVIPFSYLELGATSAAKGNVKQQSDYAQKVKEALGTKIANVMTQVERMGLSAKLLGQEELAKLFYELYNQETVNLDYNTNDIKNIIL